MPLYFLCVGYQCVWAFGLIEISNIFLGAFAKLREATISLVLPVCAFVRVEQLGFDWTDFHEL